MGRLLENVWKYRTRTWHANHHNKSVPWKSNIRNPDVRALAMAQLPDSRIQKLPRPARPRIRDPQAYFAAIQRQTAADQRMRKLNHRSTGMRKKPTKHEQIAYWALKLLNLPFHRQVVIGRYIVDFLLTTRDVILEIDGPSHAKTARYDKARDTFLRRMGWTVLRVKNEVVSFEVLKAALAPFPAVSVQDVKGRLDYSRQIERNRIAFSKEQVSRTPVRAGCMHADNNGQAGRAITPQVSEREGNLENVPCCPVLQATPMPLTRAR